MHYSLAPFPSVHIFLLSEHLYSFVSLQVPAYEQVLLLYIADLSQQVCHSTVCSYLLPIRYMHLSSGFPDPFRDQPCLDLALRGFKHRKPHSVDTHLPITPFILSILWQSLTRTPDSNHQLMLWAACCLGFFAFMRSGEFTLPAGVTFDPSRRLSLSDVMVDIHLYSFEIVHSFQCGIHILLKLVCAKLYLF